MFYCGDQFIFVYFNNFIKFCFHYNLKLKELPIFPKELPKMKYVDLHGNILKTLQGLPQMPNLKILDLSDNQLTNLKGLPNVAKLEILNLSHNQLTSINDLPELPNLRILDISCNSLDNLSSKIEQYTKLRELYLNNNQLFFLPEVIGNLLNLEELSIHTNKFHKIWLKIPKYNDGTLYIDDFAEICKKIQKWDINQVLKNLKLNRPLTEFDKEHPQMITNFMWLNEKLENVDNSAIRDFKKWINDEFQIKTKDFTLLL